MLSSASLTHLIILGARFLLLVIFVAVVVSDAFEMLSVALYIDDVGADVLSLTIVHWGQLDFFEHLMIITSLGAVLVEALGRFGFVKLSIEVVKCDDNSRDVVTTAAHRTRFEDGVD